MATYRNSIWNKAVRLTCLLCFFALGPLPLTPLHGPSPALAAGFAEDHTILYYLIEMQRRATRTCGGTLMPEAPSLMPSESLRRIAALSASSGQPVAQIAATSGLSDIPYLVATAHGSNPRQVVNALISAQCSALMNPKFHYIGAAAQNGQWTLIMAASEPRLIPLTPPDTTLDIPPDAVPGMAPSTTPTGEAILPDLTVQIGSQTQPTQLPTETQPPVPVSGSAQPGTDGTAAPQDAVERGGHIINPNSEFAPANPIVMHEFNIDGRGRLVPVSPEPAPQSVAPGPRPETRPGITPLEDTRPPGALSDDGATILVPQPGDAPALLPAQPDVQPGMQRAAPPPAPAITMPIRTTAQATPAEPQEIRMLELVNAVRAKDRVCGGAAMPAAAALRGNSSLDASAREHAKDLAVRRYFSSTTPEGRTLGQRVTDGGYAWSLVAENLLAGRSTADDALTRWLGNENQCRNLMDREFEDIGIGFEPAGPYWSIILAAPLGGGLPTQ